MDNAATLYQVLIDRYPKLFPTTENGRYQFLRNGGFECNVGWHTIISKLFFCIQDYIDNNSPRKSNLSQVHIEYVKEKYGVLAIGFQGGDNRVDGMVMFAESMSGSVCEITGLPGRPYIKGTYVKTLCPQEAEKHGFKEII